MPAMDTVLFNDPEVKGLALAILEECVDLREFGRRMLELVANAAMSARADEECGAAYGERSPERTNSRNGYRERGLATSVGDVTLRIPKLRSGSFFPDDLIERYCRVDRALVAAVAEMHVMGGVHAQGGGRRRRARRVVDVEVAGVALVRGPRRRGRRVPPPALRRRALRVPLARRNLREVPRGGPLGVPGGRDRHRARRHGPQALPGRGLRRHGEPRGLEGVPVRPARTRRRGREARRLGRARGAQGGGGRDQQATEEILKLSKGAGEALLEAEESALAYLAFPASHRIRIRTNNVQERANREIKRRANVVQGFPSRESLIRLVGAALIEADEEWSVRCVISRPSLAHAWKAPERPAPTEEEVRAAREAARRIIGSAIDPKGDEG